MVALIAGLLITLYFVFRYVQKENELARERDRLLNQIYSDHLDDFGKWLLNPPPENEK